MIFFFVHRFNDIDHFTPVVYRMAKDTREKIMVLCLNPSYDIENDFRLNFLKKSDNVSIDYLYNIYKPSILFRVFNFLPRSHSGRIIEDLKILLKRLRQRKRPFYPDAYRLTCRVIRGFMNRFDVFNRFILKHYGYKWVFETVEYFEPSVLVFDHAATTRLYNVRAFWDVAKKRNIPTISLPHGIPLFIRHSKDYDRSKRDYINNECDYIVFQHRWWRDECVEFGLDSSKTAILGIARHCQEWQEVLIRIVQEDSSLKEKGKGKLKVVYMDSGPDRYHEYKIIVQDAIDRISVLDFVHFIYKPHTRRNKVHLQVSDSVEIARDVNSVDLIKWADVIVGMHSSIMIEALQQDKVYISSKHFRKRKMIYEEYGACWVVNSNDELIQALERLNKDRSLEPYSKQSVDRFVTDVIYNGIKGMDVLGAHKDFILNIAKTRRQI